MEKRRLDVHYLVTLAMLCALLLVMGMTGIGFIPLPLIKATTMHIPVILGAIVLGPKAGCILGGVFGLCSIWANITSPSLLSFAFSPVLAYEMGGIGGLVSCLWTVLGCRILLGLAAGWLHLLLKRLKLADLLSLPITAFIATICHSLLVMGSIGLLFAEQYAQQKSVALDAVFGIAMGVVATSGVPEAIAAVILVTAIGKALLIFLAHTKKRRR